MELIRFFVCIETVICCALYASSTVVFGPSDVEVQVKSSGEETSNSTQPRRRERSVAQTEKDVLVDAINYQRGQVGASNMEYVTWNPVLEYDAQQWVNGCNFDATTFAHFMSSYLHGIKDASLNLDENFHVYVDLLETSINNGTRSTFYNNFMQNDLQYIGCGIRTCRAIQSPLTLPFTYYNYSMSLCIFSYSSSTSIKLPGAAGVYSLGLPCTNCASGSHWCKRGLCKADCSANDAACSCSIDCTFCSSSNICRCCWFLYCTGSTQCSLATGLTTTRPATSAAITTARMVLHSETTTVFSQTFNPVLGSATSATPSRTTSNLPTPMISENGFTEFTGNDSSYNSVPVLMILTTLCGVFGVLGLIISIIYFIVCHYWRKSSSKSRSALPDNHYEIPDSIPRLHLPPAYSPPLTTAHPDQPYTILDYSSYIAPSTQTESPPPYPGFGMTPVDVPSTGVARELPAYQPLLISVQTTDSTNGANQSDQSTNNTYEEVRDGHIYANVSARINHAYEGDYLPMDGNQT